MLALIIEDNRDLAANIIDYLELESIDCDYAERGDHGLTLAEKNHYDVIVLDIMLPGMDGLSVCDALRSRNIHTPVLMLTARDTLEDKLSGFRKGADDYLIKPFELAELAARIQVLSKRVAPASSNSLQIADLKVEIDSHTVTRADKEIQLTPACWKILLALMQASPTVLSKQKLEHLLWEDQPPDSEALKSHLYNLRKMIDKGFDKPLLHTIRGIGVVIKDD